MLKNKIKAYVLKYERTELRQGRGENVGKKVRIIKDYWMVKYKYADREGKNRESTKRGFKTKQEAEAYAESLKGNFISPNKLSMNQLFDIWFEDYQSEDDLANNTVQWHFYNLLHLREGLGSMLVQQILDLQIKAKLWVIISIFTFSPPLSHIVEYLKYTSHHICCQPHFVEILYLHCPRYVIYCKKMKGIHFYGQFLTDIKRTPNQNESHTT